MNIAFLFYWASLYYKEINKTLKTKYEWLYKLFLCFGKDKEKFEREKQLLEARIKNEDTVVELESLIDELQDIKTIYANGK